MKIEVFEWEKKVKVKEFRSIGRWPTLMCSFLYFDSSFMVWTLMGALGMFIAQAFQLTPSQKGLLVAIPLLVVRFCVSFLESPPIISVRAKPRSPD